VTGPANVREAGAKRFWAQAFHVHAKRIRPSRKHHAEMADRGSWKEKTPLEDWADRLSGTGVHQRLQRRVGDG
ncbi:MAG: hypothetical protein AB7F99_04205, partial [Vicinamibacterales bacterium]